MKKYIFSITCNFDSAYYVKECETRKEAIDILNGILNKEAETIKSQCGYTPSILRFSDDDVVLVYAEGFTTENREYALEDCGYYRIFEL